MPSRGGFDLHTDGVADRRASRAAVRLSFSSQCLSPKESRRGPDDMATDAAALDSRCAARSRSLPAGRWKQGHPPYTRQHRRGLIQRQDRGMPACSVVSQNGAYAVGTGLPRKSQRHAGQIPGTKKPTIRSVFSGFWCPEGDSKNIEFKGLECIVFRPHTWGHTRIFALCRPKLHHGNPSAPESMPRFHRAQNTPLPAA